MKGVPTLALTKAVWMYDFLLQCLERLEMAVAVHSIPISLHDYVFNNFGGDVGNALGLGANFNVFQPPHHICVHARTHQVARTVRTVHGCPRLSCRHARQAGPARARDTHYARGRRTVVFEVIFVRAAVWVCPLEQHLATDSAGAPAVSECGAPRERNASPHSDQTWAVKAP